MGRVLRRWSLDELPQLFNVLRGDMSLVGPRPHAVDHNEHFRQLIPGYMQRHLFKPGITGLAQVEGFRGETPDLQSMASRIDADLRYPPPLPPRLLTLLCRSIDSWCYVEAMDLTTVSPKYQVVIPKRIREQFKLAPGQVLQVIALPDRIELVPRRPVAALRGFLKGQNTFQREGDRL